MEPIPAPGLLTALVASLVPLVLFVGVVRIVVSTGWRVPGRWALTLLAAIPAR
jgi:hypothetical protein